MPLCIFATHFFVYVLMQAQVRKRNSCPFLFVFFCLINFRRRWFDGGWIGVVVLRRGWAQCLGVYWGFFELFYSGFLRGIPRNNHLRGAHSSFWTSNDGWASQTSKAHCSLIKRGLISRIRIRKNSEKFALIPANFCSNLSKFVRIFLNLSESARIFPNLPELFRIRPNLIKFVWICV